MKRAIHVIVTITILTVLNLAIPHKVAYSQSGGNNTVYLPIVTKIRDIAPPTYPASMADNWPNLNTVSIQSTMDGAQQPAKFYVPAGAGPFPLIVSLHTWSADLDTSTYPQNGAVANWAIENKWVFIHPFFRGPNSVGNTQSMGSDYAVQDIVDAVNYAKSHANVDATRIYLFGQSGGGHMALLMAGRHPEIWAGVSVWASITDLVLWYNQAKDTTFWILPNHDIPDRYGDHIVGNCGGAPLNTACANYRSPLSYLANAAGVPIDINAGFYDGWVFNNRSGSVPVNQSLIGWNALAPAAAFTTDEIDNITGTSAIFHNIPSYLAFSGTDPLYYDYNLSLIHI
jgi:pimeloyl-ACP methyl ester carboxylesterase